MTVSKRRGVRPATRRRAILICALAASNHDLAQDYAGVCMRLGWRHNSTTTTRPLDVALAAWEICDGAASRNGDAEAEALLQSGWCPGDPVVPL